MKDNVAPLATEMDELTITVFVVKVTVSPTATIRAELRVT